MKYFDFYLENPLKTYNKIKKYFKPLKLKWELSFGKSNKAKILEIHSYDLMWKDKYNSPRHEYSPRILINLFNYIHIYVFFNVEDSFNDMLYWEAALYWLYYKESLQKCVDYCNYSEYEPETQQYNPKFYMPLKEPYSTIFFNKELKDIYYDGN